MEKQEKKADAKRGGAPPQDDGKASAKVVETGKKLKDEMDQVMDEIDDVLEENAEEFIKNYVQKGGE